MVYVVPLKGRQGGSKFCPARKVSTNNVNSNCFTINVSFVSIQLSAQRFDVAKFKTRFFVPFSSELRQI